MADVPWPSRTVGDLVRPPYRSYTAGRDASATPTVRVDGGLGATDLGSVRPVSAQQSAP